MLKARIRSLVPEPIINLYHLALAHLAAVWYRHPSEKLVVIGVTGTSGKSTTVHFLGRLLEQAGCVVGWSSTVDFKVGRREWVNDKKMTMLGRFKTQRLLRDMVESGCEYAIIETSSQGIVQFRHVGINYDVVLATNLTPEHIEAHGGFEPYKAAKGRLFSHAREGKRKTLFGRTVDKTAVVNVDNEHANFFLSFGLDVQYGFGIEGKQADDLRFAWFIPLLAHDVALNATCSTFYLNGKDFHLKPIGLFNVYNALAAVTAARAVGLDWQAIRSGVAKLEPVPGRLEVIDEGQDFTVIVDYAFEPSALKNVFDAVSLLPRRKLIFVTGSAGGGRDKARRAKIGEFAATHADTVIVTNEDPYDENPMGIVNAVADAAAKAGKHDGKDLFRVLDRGEAIGKAASLASTGDLVIIGGKGSEPVMAVADGKLIPWDDREAARQALQKIIRHAPL